MQELGAYSVDFMRVVPSLLMKNSNLTLSEMINFAATQTLSNKHQVDAIQKLAKERRENGRK